jgi:hypothetical protein
MVYEEMAVRHLHAVSNQSGLRNELWLKKLEEFIKANKGKKYRLNPLDLFKSQSDNKKHHVSGGILRSAST